jgi:hypothetical protein
MAGVLDDLSLSVVKLKRWVGARTMRRRTLTVGADRQYRGRRLGDPRTNQALGSHGYTQLGQVHSCATAGSRSDNPHLLDQRPSLSRGDICDRSGQHINNLGTKTHHWTDAHPAAPRTSRSRAVVLLTSLSWSAVTT